MSETAVNSIENPVENIRDLSDFCEAWPRLRHMVLGHIQNGAIEDQGLKNTLDWLCVLSDRICAQTSDFISKETEIS